jgi:hypothetical protein
MKIMDEKNSVAIKEMHAPARRHGSRRRASLFLALLALGLVIGLQRGDVAHAQLPPPPSAQIMGTLVIDGIQITNAIRGLRFAARAPTGGPTTFGDIIITKDVDSSSPSLLVALVQRQVRNMTVTLNLANGQTETYAIGGGRFMQITQSDQLRAGGTLMEDVSIGATHLNVNGHSLF